MAIRIKGLYKITNPVGAVYIGQSVHCVIRLGRYRNFQCERQPKIFASLKKYGTDFHKYEIICMLPKDVTAEVMNDYEELYISQYKSCGIKMLNLTGGGHKNQDLSPETREKLRICATGKQHWLGRKHTEETKQKIREANTGVIFTKERLENMSKGNTGKKASDATKEKLSKAAKGRKHRPESTALISKTRIEKSKAGLYSWVKLSQEDVENIRASYVPHVMTYKILAQIYNVNKGTIADIIKKRRRVAYPRLL